MGMPSDEATVAAPFLYVVGCQPVHEALRDVLTRLGGLAMMTMLRREGAFDRSTPLLLVRDILEEAGDTLRGLAVPAEAAHHHYHMARAAEAIDRVCHLLGADPLLRAADPARQELSVELRSAADHLRLASRALPGFEMVDLRLSCCAAHGVAPSRETITELNF